MSNKAGFVQIGENPEGNAIGGNQRLFFKSAPRDRKQYPDDWYWVYVLNIHGDKAYVSWNYETCSCGHSVARHSVGIAKKCRVTLCTCSCLELNILLFKKRFIMAIPSFNTSAEWDI